MKDPRAKSSYQNLTSEFGKYIHKATRANYAHLFLRRLNNLKEPIIKIRLAEEASEIIKIRSNINYIEPYCKPLSELCGVLICKKHGYLQVVGYRDNAALAYEITIYIANYLELYAKWIRKHNKIYNKRLRAQKREGVEYSRAIRIHARRLSSEMITELKGKITKSLELLLDAIRLENDKAFYNGSIILKNIELSLNQKYGRNWKTKL